jgi:CIC family chloride channel protein
MVNGSFFLTQLERRNIRLAAGPQAYLLSMFRASSVMREGREINEAACWRLVEAGVYIDVAATLEVAMPMFDRAGIEFVPVVSLSGEKAAPELCGALFHLDALKAYNRALAATAAEEHS